MSHHRNTASKLLQECKRTGKSCQAGPALFGGDFSDALVEAALCLRRFRSALKRLIDEVVKIFALLGRVVIEVFKWAVWLWALYLVIVTHLRPNRLHEIIVSIFAAVFLARDLYRTLRH